MRSSPKPSLARARLSRLPAPLALVALLVTSACSGEGPLAPIGSVEVPATVRAELDGPFWASPFPSEHRRGPDGRFDLSGFDGKGIALVEGIVSLAAEADGFGLTSGAFFALDAELDPASLPATVEESVAPEASVFLIDVDETSPTLGSRVPVRVAFTSAATPFGIERQLALVPLQGIVLRPGARYAAVVTRDVLDARGLPLARSAFFEALVNGERPEGLGDAAALEYEAALVELALAGTPREHVAGLAVFRTGVPDAAFGKALEGARASALPLAMQQPLTLVETFDGYCVLEGVVQMPTYQSGTPPYTDEGGGWQLDASGAPIEQALEPARVVLTIPRAPKPASGYPLVIFSRTGGGGDRPLVDRGPHAVAGGPAEPGTGYAADFAEVGFAGLSIDGPHGGLRNVTGADEQFLVYNFGNPLALRDNIRQSALEIALAVDFALAQSLDVSACVGAGPGPATFDEGALAVMGHSMGASIIPLAVAFEPRLRGMVLSGAGASFLENVLHKLSPVPTKGLAEIILGYAGTHSLTTEDPVLSMLQWAGEPADMPAYARRVLHEPAGAEHHVLMLQGIVDTYILPPIANATSLSLGLDLAGEPLDDDGDERLSGFLPLEPLLAFSGRARVGFPVTGNVAGPSRTAIVVQHAEDGLEDGHEIAFQSADARRQVRCFLRSLAGGVPTVPAPGVDCP
jgi:hypothetical protein